MNPSRIPTHESKWCQRAGLNRRPKAYESSALPLSYSGIYLIRNHLHDEFSVSSYSCTWLLYIRFVETENSSNAAQATKTWIYVEPHLFKNASSGRYYSRFFRQGFRALRTNRVSVPRLRLGDRVRDYKGDKHAETDRQSSDITMAQVILRVETAIAENSSLGESTKDSISPVCWSVARGSSLHMRVCLDTNSLRPLFGNRSPFADIRNALLTGTLDLVVSTAILLEYEEVITRLSGRERWSQIAVLFDHLEALHGNVRRIDSTFQFHVITADPDDNKFVDCATSARAEFVVTDDQHFSR